MGEPTGDLARGERIVDASARERSILVSWDDGHVSELHWLWLRDNCPCESCRHPQTLERTFYLSTVPADLSAAEVGLSASGGLEITWPGDDHRSRYDPLWLRTHDYSSELPRVDDDRSVLWDAALEVPSVTYDEVMAADAGLLTWLGMLRDFGIALMHGVPTQRQQVLEVARRIAYPRPTNFGLHFDVVAAVSPNNKAYTAMGWHRPGRRRLRRRRRRCAGPACRHGPAGCA